MALTDAGIAQTRDQIATLKSDKDKLISSLEILKATIQSDENFQKFNEGTDIGARCNEKIENIISIANNSCNSTDGVISTTNSFLEEQATINRDKAHLNDEDLKVN